MKVILLSDVKNVGKKGEVKEVADGYARNYLIRNRLAVEASKRSMEILNEQKQQAAADYEAAKAEAEELKKKVEAVKLTFQVRAGKEGKLFGSVSTKQIVEQLQQEYNLTVDKRKFVDTESLTKLGFHDVKVELFKGVIATIKVEVKEG